MSQLADDFMNNNRFNQEREFNGNDPGFGGGSTKDYLTDYGDSVDETGEVENNGGGGGGKPPIGGGIEFVQLNITNSRGVVVKDTKPITIPRGYDDVPTKAIPSGGHIYKLTEGDKTHLDVYSLNVVYTSGAVRKVTLNKNGRVVQEETWTPTNSSPRRTLTIQWDDNWPVDEPPVKEFKTAVNVVLDDSNISSLLSYTFGNDSGDLSQEIYEI